MQRFSCVNLSSSVSFPTLIWGGINKWVILHESCENEIYGT